MFFAGIAGLLMPYLLILSAIFIFTFAQKIEDVSAFSETFNERNNLTINFELQGESQDNYFYFDQQLQDYQNLTTNIELSENKFIVPAEIRRTLRFSYLNIYNSNFSFNFSGLSPPCLI